MDSKGSIRNTILLLLLLIISIFIYIKLEQISSPESWVSNFITSSVGYLMVALPKIILLVILIIAAKIFLQGSNKIISKSLLNKSPKEDVKVLMSIYKSVVWILVFLIAISILYSNFGSLITSVGLIGFGITFALQKPILNFVGYMNIITYKPFKIGDLISINDVTGNVYDIGLMYTSLGETSNGHSTGKSVTIPNGQILDGVVINYTKGTPFVWDELNFSITYESDWKEATKLIEDAGESIVGKAMKELSKSVHDKFHTKIDEKPIVHIELADSSINLKLRYMCNIRERRSTATKINKKVLESVAKAKNVEFAYPHMQIVK